MMMEATGVKRQAREQAPPVAQEDACCATQSKQALARPWLIGGAVLGAPVALYAGWDWLAGAGLATTVVALLPCLAMCALGLCMGRGKKS
jgi:hypothetical protein